MKANEFIKKFGVDEARKQLKKPTGIYGAAFDYQFMEGLKSLVESHELVSKATPEELYQTEICEGIWCNHRLAQAIADVESCDVD